MQGEPSIEVSTPIGAVFLSYASQDAEAARRICDALRAGGIEVWFDQSELRGGDAWDQSIRKQIKTCALFLPVISHTTHDRREGYFRLEWKLAIDRCHLMDANLAFLLPVVIDDTRDDDERVPERFREVQWTRLPAGETPTAFVERVQRLLSGDTKATPPVSPSVPLVKRSPRPRILSPFPLLIVAVLAAGVVYWAVGRYYSSTSGVVTAIPEKSIAVLPFVDMSEKKDQEYFSDGLSEELIDHLAHAAGLRVVARTSSFQFKGRNEDVRSIALKLGVAHLLEGSVRAAGHEMRITAQLIRASDGTHLWSQTYDRQISDIFKVQDEIAEKVAQALSIALSGGVVRPYANEKNPAAYDLLLKGNFFYARSHTGDGGHAIDCYLQALALDPNYALAWAKLARAYIRQAGEPGYPSSTMEQKARNALRHALDIDPNSAVAHRWLGRIYLNFEWNWALAASELARAVALDPAGPEGKLARTDLDVLTALTTGQFDDGIQRAVAEQANNPLDPAALWFLSWFPELDGRHEQAAAYQKQLLDLDPDYRGAHGFAAENALWMGKTADALAEAEKEPDEEGRLAILARVYWRLGRSADANHALEQLESKFANEAAYDIAVVHASREDTDAALTWLERAYRQHDGEMVLLKVDSRLAGLRGQPRYQALMRQMQLNP